MEELQQLNTLVGGLVVIGLMIAVPLWILAGLVGSTIAMEGKRRSRTRTTEDDWFGPKATVEPRKLTYVTEGTEITDLTGYWALQEASFRGMVDTEPVPTDSWPDAMSVNQAMRWLAENYPEEFEVG